MSGADKTICFKKSVKSWYAADDPPFIEDADCGGADCVADGAAVCVADGAAVCVAGGAAVCVADGAADCVAGGAAVCMAGGAAVCMASGGAAVCGAVCDCWDNDFTIIK